MKIILTIKAVLNYLYNHLIESVWIKNLKFSDNSLQYSSSPKLFDIKVLSQAVADKGFAFMCKTSRQDLNKSDVPTLYNTIKNKYDNSDATYSSSTNTSLTDYYRGIQYDEYSQKYYYLENQGSNAKIYSSTNKDLSNAVEVLSGAMDYFFIGQNINVVNREYNYSIYDKNWNLIRTLTSNYNNNEISSFRVIKGDGIYILSGNANDRFYIFKINDNINVDSVIESINFLDNIISNNRTRPIKISEDIDNDNTLYISCSCEDNPFVHLFLKINKNNLSPLAVSNGIVLDNYTNGARGGINTFANISDIVKVNGEYFVISNANVYKLDIDFTNFTHVKAITGLEFIFWIEKYNDAFYLFGNGIIMKTVDFDTFETLITFTISTPYNYHDFYSCHVDSKDLCGSYNGGMMYVYGGYSPIPYTDTYTINGVSVTINYYKNNDFKICLKDGGTNDSNLDTVYNYLGYLNYWLLDLVNETVAVQRDKRTYAMMFVDDNYQDNLDNLPAYDYSPAITKNSVINSYPLISQNTINNLQDATKNTVYQADKPTVIIAGRTSNTSDWYLEIQISSDGTNFVTATRFGVANGDPASSAIIPIIVGAGVYWKVVTSLTSGYIKYGSLE